jgi:hypothetical protein
MSEGPYRGNLEWAVPAFQDDGAPLHLEGQAPVQWRELPTPGPLPLLRLGRRPPPWSATTYSWTTARRSRSSWSRQSRSSKSRWHEPGCPERPPDDCLFCINLLVPLLVAGRMPVIDLSGRTSAPKSEAGPHSMAPPQMNLASGCSSGCFSGPSAPRRAPGTSPPAAGRAPPPGRTAAAVVGKSRAAA